MGMSDYFIFGDIDTRDYEGIYVYFDDIDATPSRVGEFIEIPGRNGSFYLDKGRYEDVTHTYNIVALTMEAGRDLINAISSQVGYHRLEDSFNPDEFYSAVFASEVEPNVPTDREQMTYKLMFTRKPQRWLKSGEQEVTVSSGNTLLNPTHFASQPLLKVNGNGRITVAGEIINVTNALIGELAISKPTTNAVATLEYKCLNSGDSIYTKDNAVPSATVKLYYTGSGTMSVHLLGDGVTLGEHSSNYANVNIKYPARTFQRAHAEQILSSAVFYVEVDDGETTLDRQITASLSINYNGRETITLSCSLTNLPTSVSYANYSFSHPVYYANSSKSASNPLYIDLDVGQAYGDFDGQIVDLNSVVSLPAELPKLGTGRTAITFDNTVTALKVTPRWWKV